MSYYEDVYLKRLNRYGLDYQSRMQSMRERDFESYLLKSVYRINFDFCHQMMPGTLEPNKQDKTETTAYLLTRVTVQIPNGMVLLLPDKDNIPRPWMIWWLETMKASGYNRYTVLKMTHLINFRKEDGTNEITQWGYFCGPGDSVIKDTFKSTYGGSVFKDDMNKYYFITSKNNELRRELYFETDKHNQNGAYRIIGLDIESTPGVEYLTIEPCPKRDFTPVDTEDKDDASTYWLTFGGDDDGRA